MRRRKPRIRRSSISVVTLLAFFLLAACDRGGHPARIGLPAPEFTLTDGSQTVDLAHFRGRVVVLNFWATWCAPCIDELPSLLDMQHRLPEVTVVAISQDEDADAYRSFLVNNGVDLLTLRDPSARIPLLYGTLKIPESYVIDRNGILRRKFVSAQDWTSPEIFTYLSRM